MAGAINQAEWLEWHHVPQLPQCVTGEGREGAALREMPDAFVEACNHLRAAGFSALCSVPYTVLSFRGSWAPPLWKVFVQQGTACSGWIPNWRIPAAPASAPSTGISHLAAALPLHLGYTLAVKCWMFGELHSL